MMRRLGSLSSVSISVDGEPPKEFRIFGRGPNTTTKGVFVFDDVAASMVMEAYARHATPGAAAVMIDLEHLSLDDKAPHYDPDARGWLNLELRQGELWATGVSWTPDGDARLREKRQRFISPAFDFDPKSRRVTDIVNVAITAIPATDRLEPLVAARGTRMPMTNAEKIKCKAKELRELMANAGIGNDHMSKMHKVLAEMEDDEEPPASSKPAGKDEKDKTADAKASRFEARLDQIEVRTIIAANRARFTPATERLALKMTPAMVTELLGTLPEVAATEPAQLAREKASDPRTTQSAGDNEEVVYCATKPALEQLNKSERAVLSAREALNEESAKAFLIHKAEMRAQEKARRQLAKDGADG